MQPPSGRAAPRCRVIPLPCPSGAGLRVLEVLRLRIKEVDFGRQQLHVRDWKGRKDSVTLLPATIRPTLREHIDRMRARHQNHLQSGWGFVELPDALRIKYPSAPREWAWQWVFPATRHYTDRATGERRRHHLHETVLQRAVHRAGIAAGVAKPVSLTPFAILSPRTCSNQDPTSALDALMHTLAGPMAPLVQKFGAKLSEKKFDLRLAGDAWRGAKVLAVHPTNEGQYYGACFAALRERVAIVCCASTGDGMSKCPSMMEFLAGYGER